MKNAKTMRLSAWFCLLLGSLMMSESVCIQMASATDTPVLMAGNAGDALPQAIRDKMVIAGLDDDKISLWVEPLTAVPSAQNSQINQTPSRVNPSNANLRHNPIIRHRADQPRIPASTQKLITTFIALHTWGENHRWVTRVYPKGVIVNGILYGDLVIQGTGDPAMTHERLRAMLQQVQAQGIRHIRGNIMIDNLAFNHVKFDINAFDGQGVRAYNAAPNAFLVNFGTLEVDVLPVDNQSAMVQVMPTLADFDSPNQILTNKKSCLSDADFHLTDARLVVLNGTNAVCGRRSYWLTFNDADTLAVKAVQGEWQKLDNNFSGMVGLANKQQAVGMTLPWLIYPSKPLAEQIYLINQYSNNVMTEQMALSLPLSLPNVSASDYPKAFDFINQWWQDHLTSASPMMSRASGLCRDCQITPMAMAELLAFAYKQPNFEVFKTSLPIAGKSGTMASLIKRNFNHPAIGRAYIKTGTLNDVKSMAGYIMDSRGRWYVLVVMVNAPNAGHDQRVLSVLDEVLAYVATL
ncbi:MULTISPECIES: D-alanyl-D-alanine carboxypeptidase/D-alanyl-D-alanine-endopeptidase [unclassified Moraxella]|uniref:D-alanyl-D-alanine carboxypeptidase/D-alanyl-D-alanine endopeptidase n=1 Tax=unclassified Moraxella TaxID=2685852 RepID=UPI002B4071A7|nr:MULTISPECIES: D-alanyl-D-alanine carboxypeptidase/D-alanyl-D-alanine-endopeptidase [unclassified Moraxella]